LPQYIFTVMDDQGRRLSGTLEAANQQEGMKALAEQGRTVIKLSEVKARKEALRLSTEDLLLFTRELAAMLKTGITLKRAMDIIAADATSASMRQIVVGISSGMSSGIALSAMLEGYPAVFSRLYRSMVEAGESGGNLPEILGRLGCYIESADTLKRKVVAQLYYPVIVVVFAALVVALIFIFGMPVISNIYSGLGATLPPLTQGFINLGMALNNYWYLLVPAIIILLVGGGLYLRTEAGSHALDGFLIRMPLIGPLLLRMNISRFARSLGTLYGGGVPLINAMTLAANGIGNRVIEKAVMGAIGELKEGSPIALALERSKVFTPMTISMVAAGEESGTLDETLVELAGFYESQVEIAAKALVELVEPLIMVGVGIAVGALVLILALPFMQLFTVIK